MKSKSPVVIALDFAKQKELEAFVEKLDPNDCRLKIGKQAFTLFGPELVKKLVQQKFDVFLDLKFHDIPNTVAEACKASADLGVWMLNVHASGGTKMMSAAREALIDKSSPLLIAVTVLTSMSNADLSEQNIQSDCQEQALHLAGLTQQSGLDGVVCSSLEAPVLKKTFGKQFKLVTPGIRPKGDEKGDQQRVMTPEQALANGSDYLVIGRPITQADDPVGKLLTINSEIGWTKK